MTWFHEINAQPIIWNEKINSTKWSQKMDLLAICGQQKLGVIRLDGQKIWQNLVPLGHNDANPTSNNTREIAWRPDGKAIFLELSNGKSALIDVDTGIIYDETTLDIQEPIAKAHWISSWTEFDSCLKLKQLDSILRLSPLPPIPGKTIILNHKTSLCNPNYLDVSKEGFSHLFIFGLNGNCEIRVNGTFKLASFSINQFFDSNLKNPKYLSHSISDCGSLIHYVFETDTEHPRLKQESISPRKPLKQGENARHIYTIGLECSVLYRRRVELYNVVSRASHYHKLVKYLNSSIECLSAEYENVKALSKKFVKEAELNSKEKDGSTTNSIQHILYRLLALNDPGNVKTFLVETLGKKGIVKWKRSVISSFDSIKALIISNIHPVIMRMIIVLTELFGYAQWTLDYGFMGLKPNFVEMCLMFVRDLANRAEELLMSIECQKDLYQESFRWLEKVIDKFSTDNETEDPVSESFNVEKVILWIDKCIDRDPLHGILSDSTSKNQQGLLSMLKKSMEFFEMIFSETSEVVKMTVSVSDVKYVGKAPVEPYKISCHLNDEKNLQVAVSTPNQISLFDVFSETRPQIFTFEDELRHFSFFKGEAFILKKPKENGVLQLILADFETGLSENRSRKIQIFHLSNIDISASRNLAALVDSYKRIHLIEMAYVEDEEAMEQH